MTVDRIFLAYMVLIGVAAGAALVLAPQLENSVIKPYFWIRGNYLLGRAAAGQMVTMSARLAGFVIGVVVMVAITAMAGAQVKFF